MRFSIPAQQAPFYALEAFILLAGLYTWWRLQFSRSTSSLRETRLQPWRIVPSNFLLLCFLGIVGGIIGAGVMRLVCSLLPPTFTADPVVVGMMVNLGLHLGVVGGILTFQLILRRNPAEAQVTDPPIPPLPFSTPHAILAGVLVFLASVPFLAAVGWLWQTILDLLHVPTEKQELLDLFGQARGRGKLSLMIFIAVFLAPLTEELTFRAGFFRYFRTRLPPALSYTIPAALFAALHGNVGIFAPLFALGILFSVAYRRSGRILVTVVAHGLYNLNTIIIVLSGMNL